MKIIRTIFRWLFILCFPFFLLTISLAISFNSQWIFHYGFNKYHVSETTGLSEQNLNKIAESWTHYINSSQEYWDITIEQAGTSVTLFTREEQFHFKDVKALVWLDYFVCSLTLILCSGYIFYRFRSGLKTSKRGLAKDVIISCVLSTGIIFVLGIASFFNFDAIFLELHYLIFSNQYWYAEGYMLELFPGGFWYDATFISFGIMAVFMLLSIATAFIILRLNNKNQENGTR